MKQTLTSISLLLFLIFYVVSCTAPKFTFEHGGLSEIDFNQGKWILNRPITFGIDDDQYEYVLKEWKSLIGDSLYSLYDLRQNSLISEKIKFELDDKDLENIGLGTDCDYIITTKIEILNEELSALSPPRTTIDGATTIRSNEATVHVQIYDLKDKNLISSQKAIGSIGEVARNDVKNGISMALTSKGIAINGIDEIINYYKKNKKSRHD
ncbi:hypothetical protein [Flagellimonas onchidii]|uniref:hypothetical protein n=1 Tax=Flagellimonas onchidii TaxID=2562684 RepID=UPI0010A61246|nr:hypothetical protein [Allomuricauda onchidii]